MLHWRKLLILPAATALLAASACEPRSAKAIFPEKYAEKQAQREKAEHTLEQKAAPEARYFRDSGTN